MEYKPRLMQKGHRLLSVLPVKTAKFEVVKTGGSGASRISVQLLVDFDATC